MAVLLGVMRDACLALAAWFASRLQDAERALKLHLFCAALHGRWLSADEDPAVLAMNLCGMALRNPIGLSAGCDKNAEAIVGLLSCGFGLVECGTVTPLAQLGSARPRIFRLLEDQALINRYNPSAGVEAARANLVRARASTQHALHGPIGVNVGAMKDASDPAVDMLTGVRLLGGHASYLTINLSNPTIAGTAAPSPSDAPTLRTLLRVLRGQVDALPPAPHRPGPPPLFVKLPADVDAARRAEVAEAVLAERIDGMIVANASLRRPATLRSAAAAEAGGLSGAPLREGALELLADMYRRTGGKVPLIGVGGVSSGRDAYARIRAGASAVQLYTAFLNEGLPLLPRIKRELAALLEADGFRSVAEAVGADHRAQPAT